MKNSLLIMLGVMAFLPRLYAAEAAAETPVRVSEDVALTAMEVNDAYPGLASGVLTYARLADLAPGTLLRSGDVTITADDLEAAVNNAPPNIQAQLRKNSFFLLEQLAARKILASVARNKTGSAAAEQTNNEAIRAYFSDVVSTVNVSQEEIKSFYDENKDMFGGAKLDAVKTEIESVLLQQKQQDAVSRHIRELGKKVSIEVSEPRVKEQSVAARDNPVDKARLSGKPTMVDFGRGGCVPCDMMTPILATLKKKYEGKANILFVHVGDEEILGVRYGVELIPLQVFFDKDGKEVFRHVGFFPQNEIEKKLAEMGVN